LLGLCTQQPDAGSIVDYSPIPEDLLNQILARKSVFGILAGGERTQILC
jgi:hypothetical protein